MRVRSIFSHALIGAADGARTFFSMMIACRAMKRFITGAAPLYALAALAALAYFLVYRMNVLDVKSLADLATRSEHFSLFIFLCFLLESIFPYCGYFPGTALVLVTLVLGANQLTLETYVLAWLAILVGSAASYVQARFFHPLLKRVASAEAISHAKASLVRFGPFARVLAYAHPNLSAVYFTALGLLARPLLPDLIYLCGGAVFSVALLFAFSRGVAAPLGVGDSGLLQLFLAAGLFLAGTWAGLRAARNP